MAKKQVKKSDTVASISELKKENQALKKQLQESKNTAVSASKTASKARFFTKWGAFSLAGAVFIVGTLLLYIGLTLTDTTRFMKVAGPLIEQPAVQERLADKTTNALFSTINTEQLATEVLPERVSFLAPTLSQQIEKFANDKAKEAIATDTFRQTWVSSLEKSHSRLISSLKNSSGDGVLQIQEIYYRLGKRVEDGKLGFLAGRQLPENIGNITVVNATWLPIAREVVKSVTILRVVAISLFILLLAVSIVVANRKRRTIIEIGSMVGILSLFLILSLRIVKEYLITSAKPENQELVTQVATVFGRPLVLQLTITAVIGLSVALVAWLGGQSKSARSCKQKINYIFAGKLHQAFFKQENSLTIFVGKFSRELYALITAGLFISLLLIDLGNGSLLTTFVIASFLALVVNTLGSKKKN